MNKKTTGPVEIHLSTRRNFTQEQPPDGFDLAGFEVLGAARQWGTIAVAVGNDRQVVWGPQQGVRQTDLLPESLHGEGIVAGFEYSSYPYTLTAGLAPRKTRINVDPEYVLLVGQDRIDIGGEIILFYPRGKGQCLAPGHARLGNRRGRAGKYRGPRRHRSRRKRQWYRFLCASPRRENWSCNFAAHKTLDKSAGGFSVGLAPAASSFAGAGDSGGGGGR